MDSPQVKLLYRVKAVADKLDVSKSQIYAMVNRGELEFVRVGHSIRIPAWAIEKLAASPEASRA